MTGATPLVVDTSALLASLLNEPGGDEAARHIAASATVLLSSVNLAETIAVFIRRHGPSAAAEAAADIALIGAEIIPFGAPEAACAAGLAAAHRGTLSLGDAACLAAAMLRGAPVLTADRAWAGLGLPIEITLLR